MEHRATREHVGMHVRRLSFAVGTSLLTASLSTGCAKPQRVNVWPPDEPQVNEGPEPAEEPATDVPEQPATDVPEDEQPRTVNVRGPE